MFVFKVLCFVLILLFSYNISFLRSKSGMKPLMPKWSTVLLKIIYPIALGIHAWVVLRSWKPETGDWLGLALMGLAAWLVWKSRRDLGNAHTWTGYCLENTSIVRRGIYGWLRHPLYLGIMVYIIGTGLMVALHGWLAYLAILALLDAYILLFVYVSSLREDQYLEKTLGEEYFRYRVSTGAYVPRFDRLMWWVERE